MSTDPVPGEPARGRHRHRPAPPAAAARPAGAAAGCRAAGGACPRSARPTPSASDWPSSRRAPWSASTRSPRGRSIIAASVHGPATANFTRPCVALGQLLELVEVRPQRGSGQPVVPAGAVGQPPAGRLQVDGQPGQQRGGAADQLRRARPRAGSSGRYGSSGHSAKADLDRVAHVGAGPGADARCSGPASGRRSRGRGGDGGAADDAGAVVEHHGLARGDAGRRVVEGHVSASAVGSIRRRQRPHRGRGPARGHATGRRTGLRSRSAGCR